MPSQIKRRRLTKQEILDTIATNQSRRDREKDAARQAEAQARQAEINAEADEAAQRLLERERAERQIQQMPELPSVTDPNFIQTDQQQRQQALSHGRGPIRLDQRQHTLDLDQPQPPAPRPTTIGPADYEEPPGYWNPKGGALSQQIGGTVGQLSREVLNVGDWLMAATGIETPGEDPSVVSRYEKPSPQNLIERARSQPATTMAREAIPGFAPGTPGLPEHILDVPVSGTPASTGAMAGQIAATAIPGTKIAKMAALTARAQGMGAFSTAATQVLSQAGTGATHAALNQQDIDGIFESALWWGAPPSISAVARAGAVPAMSWVRNKLPKKLLQQIYKFQKQDIKHAIYNAKTGEPIPMGDLFTTHQQANRWITMMTELEEAGFKIVNQTPLNQARFAAMQARNTHDAMILIAEGKIPQAIRAGRLEGNTLSTYADDILKTQKAGELLKYGKPMRFDITEVERNLYIDTLRATIENAKRGSSFQKAVEAGDLDNKVLGSVIPEAQELIAVFERLRRASGAAAGTKRADATLLIRAKSFFDRQRTGPSFKQQLGIDTKVVGLNKDYMDASNLLRSGLHKEPVFRELLERQATLYKYRDWMAGSFGKEANQAAVSLLDVGWGAGAFAAGTFGGMPLAVTVIGARVLERQPRVGGWLSQQARKTPIPSTSPGARTVVAPITEAVRDRYPEDE